MIESKSFQFDTAAVTTNNHFNEEWKAILSGLIGGAKYGIKIRFPHALVMTFLFKRNLSLKRKIQIIVKLVMEHSRNLAFFAALYKTLLFLLKWSSRRLLEKEKEKDTNPLQWIGQSFASLIVNGSYREQCLQPSLPGQPQLPHHSLIAGAIGGYYIWGRHSSVNYQIVLYLTSRVLMALFSFLRAKTKFRRKMYSVHAAIVWGAVMMLFEEYPEFLHISLKKSMDEIYRQEANFDNKAFCHKLACEKSMIRRLWQSIDIFGIVSSL